MSRRFRVKTNRSQALTYDVVLAGTVDPEETEVDWLELVRKLEPVEDAGEFIVLASIEEILPDGQ